MDNRQRAEQIYNQNKPAVEKWQRAGMKLTGIMAATIEQIEAHLTLVDEVSREFGFRLDADKIEFGATREQVEAIAQSKARNYKNRAGVKALEQKYGHEAAARIVRQHSGRNIR